MGLRVNGLHSDSREPTKEAMTHEMETRFISCFSWLEYYREGQGDFVRNGIEVETSTGEVFYTGFTVEGLSLGDLVSIPIIHKVPNSPRP